jgi:serine/threonine-protein kinase
VGVKEAEKATEEPVVSEDDASGAVDSFLHKVAGAPTPQPDLVGVSLGRFRVLAVLGRGGMGVVYRARDENLRRDVALKVLPRTYTDDPSRRRRFLREARSAAAVTHPCVASIFEVSEAEGDVFIAMELVEGQSLRALLGTGLLPLDRVLRFVVQIARGLAKAHERGIVHRDLKPENVMVDAEDHVKILDFGLAKAAPNASAPEGAEGAASTELTGEGQVFGTPAYMSPEQIRGEDTGAATDVFSFGVMLHELLAGERPFHGAGMEILVAIARDEAPPVGQSRPGIPIELEAIVARCLRKEAALRYASARELLTDLERVAQTNETPSQASQRAALEGAATFALHTPASASAAVSVARLGASATEATRAPPAGLVPRRMGLVVAVVVAIAGAMAVLWWRSTPTTPAGGSVPSAAAPDGGTPEKPVSADPEAVRAYEEGSAALRASDWPRARDGFERALARDPDCGAAAVQLLVMTRGLSFNQDTTRHRELYRRVDAKRDRLSARDVALLDAVQPLIMREPPDPVAMGERLIAASDRFDRDAELADLAANYAFVPPETSLRLLDRALALDPAHLDSMQGRARALFDLGRDDEAMRELNDCVSKSPGADCGLDRVIALCNAGRRSEAVAAARDYVAGSAGAENAYEALSMALAADGAPEPALVEVIRRHAALEVASMSGFLEAFDLAQLDVSRGRLAAAERRARELATKVDRWPDAFPHERVTRLLADLYRERGDAKALAALASDFEARHPLWGRNANLEAATPTLLASLDETGVTPHDEILRRMAIWREATAKRFRRSSRAVAYATQVVRTADEARSALAQSARAAAYDTRFMDLEAMLGRARLLAGEVDLARESLERATRACGRIVDPFGDVRAHLWLGAVHEARHDTAAACGAYEEVLRRWGTETPLAKTAQAAKARRAALRCP